MNNISIPKPCSANWHEMTPQEQGRHCKACQKTVYDATEWEDQKILDMYKQAGNNLCIQIQKNRVSPCESKARTSWKYAALAFILLLWFTVKSKVIVAQESNEVRISDDGSVAKTITGIQVSGSILFGQEEKEKVAYAVIVMSQRGKTIGGAYSNEDGKYEAKLAGTFTLGDTITIECKYIGFETLKADLIITKKMEVDAYLKDTTLHYKKDFRFEQRDEKAVIMVGMVYYLPDTKRKTDNTKTIKSEEIVRGNLGR